MKKLLIVFVFVMFGCNQKTSAPVVVTSDAGVTDAKLKSSYDFDKLGDEIDSSVDEPSPDMTIQTPEIGC